VIQEGIEIKKYHADNGIFATKAFKEECDLKGQGYLFSGVGAHQQNGVAERNITTIVNWAQANMLHMAHHWPEHANICFWPQAIEYSIWTLIVYLTSSRVVSLQTSYGPHDEHQPKNSTGLTHLVVQFMS
jgi:hypothetical protein